MTTSSVELSPAQPRGAEGTAATSTGETSARANVPAASDAGVPEPKPARRQLYDPFTVERDLARLIAVIMLGLLIGVAAFR